MRPEQNQQQQPSSTPPATAARSTILHLLRRCSTPSHLSQIQAQLLLRNLHADTTHFPAFVAACASLRLLPTALLLLLSTHLPRPNVFSCNSLLRALSRSCSPSSQSPLRLFSHMLERSVSPNSYTFPPLFKSLSELRQGQFVQTHIVKSGHWANLYTQNSLLGFYASCREFETCERVFDEMPLRDAVSWATLLSGYRNAGRLADALDAFQRMQLSGVLPCRVTLVSALAACARSRDLDLGIWIHEVTMRTGWGLDVVLGTALVDMYRRCGRVNEAMTIFNSMEKKNVVTWNSLLSSLASDGHKAVRLFFEMNKKGVKADEVTLLVALKACSRSGLVHVGEWLFQTIRDGKYGFMPGIKHYGCVIDLLGRAGKLEEALEYIELMPFEPNVEIWRAFLGGCIAHKNLELSELAAQRLVELEPEHWTYYAFLSAMYAASRRSKDALRLRKLTRDCRLSCVV